MSKSLTLKASSKSTKGISLSRGTKVFEALLLAAEMKQDILTHTPEQVTEFTETTGVQFLTSIPSRALTIIPGQGVVDLTSKATSKAAQRMVTLHLPQGSTIGNGCVYTKEWEGKARWFDTKLITFGTLADGTIWVQASEKSVKSRGMLHLIQA